MSAPPSRPSIRTTWTAGPTSRGVTAARTLSVQMTKVGFSGCAYNKPCDGWRGGCIGSPQCRQHRTPTDPLAAHLETIDFSKPGYGELLRKRRGRLVLCAAGSLLVPVRCSHCHGIKRLKRGRDGVDESDAVRWITATAFRTAASGRSSNGPSRGARGRATATTNRARAFDKILVPPQPPPGAGGRAGGRGRGHGRGRGRMHMHMCMHMCMCMFHAHMAHCMCMCMCHVCTLCVQNCMSVCACMLHVRAPYELPCVHALHCVRPR